MFFAPPAGADLNDPTANKVERNHGSLTGLTDPGRLELLLAVGTKELNHHFFGNENIRLDFVTSIQRAKIEEALLFFVLYQHFYTGMPVDFMCFVHQAFTAVGTFYIHLNHLLSPFGLSF